VVLRGVWPSGGYSAEWVSRERYSKTGKIGSYLRRSSIGARSASVRCRTFCPRLHDCGVSAPEAVFPTLDSPAFPCVSML
jgi:hypothetical protein